MCGANPFLHRYTPASPASQLPIKPCCGPRASCCTSQVPHLHPSTQDATDLLPPTRKKLPSRPLSGEKAAMTRGVPPPLLWSGSLFGQRRIERLNVHAFSSASRTALRLALKAALNGLPVLAAAITRCSGQQSKLKWRGILTAHSGQASCIQGNEQHGLHQCD